MSINWITFTINLFQLPLTNYECSSWYQTIFQKLRTMNHRTASFNFKQLFKIQLIALTISWATYHSQSIAVTFNKFYMFLSESNNFSEVKNSMNLAQKEQIYFHLNRFISLLFYQLCRNEIEESEREWTQAVILVHSTELHPVFTKTRWKSLKHSTTKYNSHCSWNLQELRYSCWKNLFQLTHTHTLQENLSRRVFNQTITSNEKWNDCTWLRIQRSALNQ